MQSMESSIENVQEYKVTSNHVAHLQILRQKITKAKDEVEQSWLDSRSLIYNLQRVNSELANAKCRTNVAATVLSDHQCKHESMKKLIRSKKEKETEIQMMVNEMKVGVGEVQEEMEGVSLERDENRLERDRLKDDLRMKKQSLEAMQLTLRAIRLESEACSASSHEAHRFLNNLISETRIEGMKDTDTDTMVSLTQEEYRELKKTAMEEASLAEWRILVSIERQNAAEKSRDRIARKLQRLKSKDGSSKTKTDAIDDHGINEDTETETEAIDDHGINEDTETETETESKTKTEAIDDHGINEVTETEAETEVKELLMDTNINEQTSSSQKKNEGSVLNKIRLCLLQKSKDCFG